MTGYDEDTLVARPRRRHRLGRDSLELLGVAVERPSDHFTRLWPARPNERADTPLFLAAMLPLRLTALALLWLTSSPGRLVVVLALVLAVVLAH